MPPEDAPTPESDDDRTPPLAPDRLSRALSADLRRLASTSITPSDLAALDTPGLMRRATDQVRALQKGLEEAGEQQLRENLTSYAEALRSQEEFLEAPAASRRELVTRPVEDGFVVAGRVVNADSGEPLPLLRVEAVERDPEGEDDDLLGTAETGELGFYRIEYTAEDFHAAPDEEPETFVRILARKGDEPLFISDRSFRHQAGEVEVIDAAVPDSEIPADRPQPEEASAEFWEAAYRDLQTEMTALNADRHLRADPTWLFSTGSEQP